jgi:hypothetical protein
MDHLDRLGAGSPLNMPVGPRTSIAEGGILDHSTGRICGLPPYGPIPNGAFVDPLGLVRHPLDGHVMGQMQGDRIVPPSW